jgi:dynein heavy chain
MASAFVSYAGPFNKSFRDIMIRDEFLKFFKSNNLSVTPNISPARLLTDDSTAALWNQQSLPSDKVSV